MPDIVIDRVNLLGTYQPDLFYLLIARADSLEIVISRSQEWTNMAIKIRPCNKLRIKMISNIKRIKRSSIPNRRTKKFNNPYKLNCSP